jgi:hypothetical protein
MGNFFHQTVGPGSALRLLTDLHASRLNWQFISECQELTSMLSVRTFFLIRELAILVNQNGHVKGYFLDTA